MLMTLDDPKDVSWEKWSEKVNNGGSESGCDRYISRRPIEG